MNDLSSLQSRSIKNMPSHQDQKAWLENWLLRTPITKFDFSFGLWKNTNLVKEDVIADWTSFVKSRAVEKLGQKSRNAKARD